MPSASLQQEIHRVFIIILLKHFSNDLARDITNIFLPLWHEIFIHKKRNQVETGNHVLNTQPLELTYSCTVSRSFSDQWFEPNALRHLY